MLVESIIASSYEGCVADTHLVETVHDRSGGCPLFIEYIARWALDAGALNLDAATREVSLDDSQHENSLELPKEISSIVLGAFNSLPPIMWDVLKIASCIGYAFDPKLTRL